MHIRLQDLAPAAILLVLVGVIVPVGAMIVNDVQDTAETDYGNTSGAYNAAANSIQALITLSDWQALIALVISAGIIIGVLLGAFAIGGTF